MSDIHHYNQVQRRKAEIIDPPNLLKAKVGSGGLSEVILDRAQLLLEHNKVDFVPLAEVYLKQMQNGIDKAKNMSVSNDTSIEKIEEIISYVLMPCVQLKGSAGMFHYPLISRVADRCVQFLEVIENFDSDAIEISQAFHTTIKIIVSSKITGNGGVQGDALVEELNGACMRYFEKYNIKKEN